MITDEQRLNFIETHPGWLTYTQKRKHWQCVNPFTNYEWPVFKTAREAIDWAIGEYV